MIVLAVGVGVRRGRRAARGWCRPPGRCPPGEAPWPPPRAD